MLLEQLLAEVPLRSGASRRPVRARVRRGEATAAPGPSCAHRRSPRSADDDARSARILSHRTLMRTLSRPTSARRSRRTCAVRSSWRSGSVIQRSQRSSDRTGRECWRRGLPTSRRACSSGVWRSRNSSSSPARVPPEPARRCSPAVLLASGRARSCARACSRSWRRRRAARGDEDTRVMILGFDLGPLEWFADAGRWRSSTPSRRTTSLSRSRTSHGRCDSWPGTRRRSRRISASSSRRAPRREGLRPRRSEPRTSGSSVRNLAYSAVSSWRPAISKRARPSCAGSPPGSLALGLDSTDPAQWADTIETLIASR